MKNSKIIIWGLVAGILYFLIGSFSLGVSSNNIDAKNGNVWVTIERGTELLPRLESLVKKEMSDRKDILEQITLARKSIQTATENNDIDKASKSLSSLKVIFENNTFPSGLPGIQRDLITNTEGTINRIAYARKNLIDAQQGYNNTRLFFLLNQAVTEKVEILGGSSNPRNQLPESQF